MHVLCIATCLTIMCLSCTCIHVWMNVNNYTCTNEQILYILPQTYFTTCACSPLARALTRQRVA